MRFAGWLVGSVLLLVGTVVLADAPAPGDVPQRGPRPRILPAPVAPRAAEASKSTAPVELRHEDLSKEGKGVTAKISIGLVKSR